MTFRHLNLIFLKNMKLIEDMTMEQLIAYEKAAVIIRKKYEDALATLSDTSSSYENAERASMNKTRTKINAVYLTIISEMEKRLLGVK